MSMFLKPWHWPAGRPHQRKGSADSIGRVHEEDDADERNPGDAVCKSRRRNGAALMPLLVPACEADLPRPLITGAVTVEIGGLPILLDTNDPGFRKILEKRYAGFLNPSAAPACRFEIELISAREPADEDVRVFRRGSTWCLQRGDFRAEWDLRRREGWIRQCANPYSIDSVLRITHSLLLAMEGGFQAHASSAIRNSRAFLFAGVSGAGKTTTVSMAPSDAVVLTDEISYVRRVESNYRAYGTPFAGELARPGANASAPVQRVCLLKQGPQNCLRPVRRAAAIRALMRHVLFFAQDSELVERVLDSVVQFVSSVEVMEMEFTPDRRAWELVQ